MGQCILCGSESASALCESCKGKCDIEKLCLDIIAYRPGNGENALWDRISEKLENPNSFRKIAFELSRALPSPRGEYVQAMAMCEGSANVCKAFRTDYLKLFDAVRDADGLTDEERRRMEGLALGARYMDYEYDEAERLGTALCRKGSLPWQTCANLAEYYTTTRRYDMADLVIEDALDRFSENPDAVRAMQNKAEKNDRQRARAEAGKQEYLPNPRENRDEARKKYIDFMKSIGIDVLAPYASRPKNIIPRDRYPAPREITDPGFDTFVAFDLETTGLNTSHDSIIEIAAIKVVAGALVEVAEFEYQSFVQPLDSKKVLPQITALTGITNEDIHNARPIWEVLPEFMRFAGDAVLLGYNCMAFDSRFMVRAGRYSNLIIQNPYFDVMRYADHFAGRFSRNGRKNSLSLLAGKLGIVNPKAHRALDDAITTARVFLAMRALEPSGHLS